VTDHHFALEHHGSVRAAAGRDEHSDLQRNAGPVVSEVDVETEHGIVTSVITSRSVKELQLQVGTEVLALVKATEVSIAKL
jgi:molybdopterin-binding protein